MSNLILCGFKASGKTYFGKRLAEKLNRPFIETDALIEKNYGKGLSCREIHENLGAKAFRDLEHEVVRELLKISQSVISLGGGTLFQPKNLPYFSELGVLIYLNVSKEVLKKRIFSQNLPSFFEKQDPEGSFEKLYRQGIGVFERVSHKNVILDGKKDEDILQELVAYGIE